METGGLILLCAILVIAAYFFGRVGYAIENDKKEKSDDVEINEPVKNDNCNRVIYLLIRNSYYANDLKTLKRIYELLVAEGIIDEFQIDKDMWNEFRDKLGASTTSYLFFFKDSKYNSSLDSCAIMMLQEKYFHFMGLLENNSNED